MMTCPVVVRVVSVEAERRLGSDALGPTVADERGRSQQLTRHGGVGMAVNPRWSRVCGGISFFFGISVSKTQKPLFYCFFTFTGLHDSKKDKVKNVDEIFCIL